MPLPMIYEKVRGVLNRQQEWSHPDLRVALSPFHVKRIDYPSILQELKKLKMIKIEQNGIKVL